MTPWNTNAVSASSSSVSLSDSDPPPQRSRWASLVGRLRASAWTAMAARVAGVVVALLVLGWIGRTAAAGPTGALSVAAADRDAAAPLLPTLVPIDAGASMVAAEATGAATPAAAAPPASPPGARGRASATEPVYLNHASVDELRRLPGVGPKRAEAILVLRQRLGRFQRVEDLLRVKGIGRSAVKKWRPLVRLDAPDAGGV